MAKDASLIVGGTGVPMFPNCDSSLNYGAPYAKEIAWEYARGYFTLSKPINPFLMQWQRTALATQELTVGSVIYLSVVPARHLITSVHVTVKDADEKLAGMTLTPVLAQVPLNSNTATITEDLGNTVATVDPTTRGAQYYAPTAPVYTGDNSYLVGLQITTMPTDSKYNIADMRAVINVVTKAQDFATHEQE